MPGDPGEPRKPVVFISYAHEGEAFDASVGALAKWLRERGFEVISDHDYRYRPPGDGWTPWMTASIDGADFVLVVCTPTMRKIFHEGGRLPVRGATVEVRLILSHLRPRLGQNRSCYPILAEGGSSDHIPAILGDWDMRLSLALADRPAIERLLGGPLQGGPDEGGQPAGPDLSSLPAHERLTMELLSNDMVEPFRSELGRRLGLALAGRPVTQAAQLTTKLRDCPAERAHGARKLVGAVIDAAKESLPPGTTGATRKAIEEAAFACFYCIAKHLVVDSGRQADRNGQSSRVGVVPTPTSERLVVAAIVASLIPGVAVRVRWESQEDLPRVEGDHEIIVPSGSFGWMDRFLRAVFLKLYPGDREALDLSRRDAPLTPRERLKIEGAIKATGEFADPSRGSIFLVVHDAPDDSDFHGFAGKTGIAVAAPRSEADELVSGLLCIPVHDFMGWIRYFTQRLRELRGGST